MQTTDPVSARLDGGPTPLPTANATALAAASATRKAGWVRRRAAVLGAAMATTGRASMSGIASVRCWGAKSGTALTKPKIANATIATMVEDRSCHARRRPSTIRTRPTQGTRGTATSTTSPSGDLPFVKAPKALDTPGRSPRPSIAK